MNGSRKIKPLLQRRIRYGQEELYYRYLGINLPLLPGKTFCGGRFANFLDKKLGIRRLPYSITMLDLVSSNCITPVLTVKLPRSYFEEWLNFPYCPRQGSGGKDKEYAGMYGYEAVLSEIKDVDDVIHPYDGVLKSEFVEKYKKDFSLEAPPCQHPNGRHYKAGELYFSYWQGLALASSIQNINSIEAYLPPEEGVKKAKDIISSTIKSFGEKYGESLDRVSWYRAATAAANLSEIKSTHLEILQEVGKNININQEVLTLDLENLLCLHNEWTKIVESKGAPEIKACLKIIQKDIYLIFEQLRILGVSDKWLFKKFSSGRNPCLWTSLSDVLFFESYSLKTFFKCNLNMYCVKVKRWGFYCTPEVFEGLSKYNSFYPWIRALYDLHQNLRWDGEVDFTHSRIIDNLIVASVRTEVVIREMIGKNFQALDADIDFINLLMNLSSRIHEKYGRVVRQVQSESSTTKLHSRPEPILNKIDSINYKKWSKEDLHFLKSILKFICTRNYFAHHSYMDNDIDIATSELAAETIMSIVETLLYFHWICSSESVSRSSGKLT